MNLKILKFKELTLKKVQNKKFNKVNARKLKKLILILILKKNCVLYINFKKIVN